MRRIVFIAAAFVIGMLANTLAFSASGNNSSTESEISPEEDLGFDDPDFTAEQTGTNSGAVEQKNNAGPSNSTPKNLQNIGSDANTSGNVSQSTDPAKNPSILQPASEDPAMDSDATVAPLTNAAVAPEIPAMPAAAPPASSPLTAQPITQDMEITAEKIGEPNEFAGAPLVPGTMRNVAEGEAPEEYIVESGDTLFDVCSQLLDEGGYWPKLWSVNPQIKNPHFIWPGMRLTFYPGDSETPPFLEVATEEDIIPIDKGNLVEEQLLHGKVPDMDKSFEVQPTEVIDGKDLVNSVDVESQLAVVGALFDPTSRKITLPGFIYAEMKEPAAIVIGGVEGEAMIGEGRQILAESKEKLPAGTTYTVLRAESRIRSPKTGDEVGYFYSFIANVKVLSNIPGKDLSMMEVVQSRLGVERNDILVPFISTSRTMPIGNGVGSLSNIVGNVVAFEHEGQVVGGEGSMLFLDKGNKSGISIGQFYKVFSRPGFLATAEISRDLQDTELPVAIIKIIDTTDAGAVGFIVKNAKEVHVGDSLGRG
jgi:hypothetical protein